MGGSQWPLVCVCVFRGALGNSPRVQDGRVHCSLNINTETGRLSCRRPNLQNQPALEKDRYFIRKAFRAEAGRTLAVADYGQLELRILAHLTDCSSMIAAFESGGDFHSRTAAGMFDFIQARPLRSHGPRVPINRGISLA